MCIIGDASKIQQERVLYTITKYARGCHLGIERCDGTDSVYVQEVQLIWKEARS
jgi:hypothetical protein